jgi:hypothetical protein
MFHILSFTNICSTKKFWCYCMIIQDIYPRFLCSRSTTSVHIIRSTFPHPFTSLMIQSEGFFIFAINIRNLCHSVSNMFNLQCVYYGTHLNATYLHTSSTQVKQPQITNLKVFVNIVFMSSFFRTILTSFCTKILESYPNTTKAKSCINCNYIFSTTCYPCFSS